MYRLRKQSANPFAKLCASAHPRPSHCQTRVQACHWQFVQRKFHNICLLSHNGAPQSTGSGAGDEAEAKLRVCYCWRFCQGKKRWVGGGGSKVEGKGVIGGWRGKGAGINCQVCKKPPQKTEVEIRVRAR